MSTHRVAPRVGKEERGSTCRRRKRATQRLVVTLRGSLPIRKITSSVPPSCIQFRNPSAPLSCCHFERFRTRCLGAPSSLLFLWALPPLPFKTTATPRRRAAGPFATPRSRSMPALLTLCRALALPIKFSCSAAGSTLVASVRGTAASPRLLLASVPTCVQQHRRIGTAVLSLRRPPPPPSPLLELVV